MRPETSADHFRPRVVPGQVRSVSLQLSITPALSCEARDISGSLAGHVERRRDLLSASRHCRDCQAQCGDAGRFRQASHHLTSTSGEHRRQAAKATAAVASGDFVSFIASFGRPGLLKVLLRLHGAMKHAQDA
jgi:hypothetical protein